VISVEANKKYAVSATGEKLEDSKVVHALTRRPTSSYSAGHQAQ